MSGIALKLTSLLVRTVAKPIATTMKAQAKEHEVFKRVCISIAQTVHSTDLRLRMSLLGEKKIKIRPLNDTKAIDQGATFLSELFIFSVAGSLILYESYRSRKKASDQRDAIADDISVLQYEIEYMKTKFLELDVKFDDFKLPEGVHPKYIKILNPSKPEEAKEIKNIKENIKENIKDVSKDNVLKENVDKMPVNNPVSVQ